MNRLTLEERQRGIKHCGELRLIILRHQYKNAHSPRKAALIEARAKILKRTH